MNNKIPIAMNNKLPIAMNNKLPIAMNNKIPIALINSHSGLALPPELNGRIALTPQHIFNEADAYTDNIFDFRDRVLYFETFPFSRAIIDVNRPADPNLHPRNGDGAIKRITSYGHPVYQPGMEPEADLEQQLIDRYWQPWHDRLANIEQDSRVKLVIDCHSMAAIGPSGYDDPSQLRPRVEVANLGDCCGNLRPSHNHLSAPADVTCFLAKRLGETLADVPELAETGASWAVNTPFWGGWNIRVHSRKNQSWLMIEVNRALYIGNQNADTPIVPLNAARAKMLSDRIWPAITSVTEYILTRT